MFRRFTLIEVIIVIIVLSILAAIVIPNTSGVKDDAKQTAITSNKAIVQTTIDFYKFNKDKTLPIKGKPDVGNPRPIDLETLVPDMIRNNPDDGLHYYLDKDGIVHTTMVETPIAINVVLEKGEVYWNKVEGAESYNIYKKASALGEVNGKSQLVFIENVKNNFYQGEPYVEYLVSAIDRYGNETVPIGENYEGEIESYISLDGESDYLVASKPELLDMDKGDFTVEVWVKIDEHKNIGTIISKGSWFEYGSNGYFIAYPHRPAYIYVGVKTDDKRHIIRSKQLDEKFGWNHIALVKKGHEIKLYVNGEEDAATHEATDEVYGSLSNSGDFIVGKNDVDVYRHRSYFNGGISEIRVWNYARTGEELKRDMSVKLTGQEVGLISAWRFDNEETALKDITPNNNDLISHGHSFVK